MNIGDYIGVSQKEMEVRYDETTVSFTHQLSHSFVNSKNEASKFGELYSTDIC